MTYSVHNILSTLKVTNPHGAILKPGCVSEIDEQHTELRWREKGWQERSEGGKGRRCPPARPRPSDEESGTLKAKARSEGKGTSLHHSATRKVVPAR